MTNDKLIAGKTFLVTGATSGIGEATALELARQGGRVIVVSRNQERCEKTVLDIRAKTDNQEVDFIVSDLSSMKSIRSLVETFKERYERLDVLINNAGAFFLRRQESVDGYEMTFALNHLNYFLLTNLLLETLKANVPARVVNVSSNSHYGRPLDFNDLQLENGYGGVKAYGRSKMANVLFTNELARRLEGTNVTANALHPGFVATEIGKNNGLLARLVMNIVHRFSAIPVKEGIKTVTFLATSTDVEGVTGKYFVKQKPVRSDPYSYDQDAAKRLWEISQILTKI